MPLKTKKRSNRKSKMNKGSGGKKVRGGFLNVPPEYLSRSSLIESGLTYISGVVTPFVNMFTPSSVVVVIAVIATEIYVYRNQEQIYAALVDPMWNQIINDIRDRERLRARIAPRQSEDEPVVHYSQGGDVESTHENFKNVEKYELMLEYIKKPDAKEVHFLIKTNPKE